VTRKQFGVMLGAGVAMMLPQVANAVTVTESGWTETRVLLGEPGANGGLGVR